MKKILIVTDAWRPQVNGVVRVLDALIPRLKERGYEVRVIEPGQFRSFVLPTYRELRVALFPRRGVEKVFEEYQPDAVCLMTEATLGWAARAACKKRGIPFVTWYHTHYQLYADMRLHGLLRLVETLMFRFHRGANRTIASTKTLKGILEANGVHNVVVVPLGVETDFFTRSKHLPEKLEKPVFVYLSRLAPEKSPEEFMTLDLPGTKLVIGDGPSRPELEKQYGDRNRFVGYKHGQELVDWMSLADVLVFPSRTETFGLVALEALSCGIPVAAHDVMGPRDVITPGKDGYLGEDLREAALKCLELKSEDCRAKALEYTWGHHVDAFVKSLVWIEK